MSKQILNEEFKRMQKLAGIYDKVQDNSFEKEFKYLKISPEKFIYNFT